MLYLLNWRIWALVAVLALGPIGYFKGRSDGKKLILAETAAATAQANVEVRKITQRRQDVADEAARLGAADQARIVADAAHARAQRDGLRDDLSAVRLNAEKSSDAASKSVAALSDVFQRCVRSYSDLAEVADRHAADTLTLQRAWPK